MVRNVVSEMLKFHKNPNLALTRVVTRKIVHAYPASFEDRTVEGERLGSGYHSLAQQLKTRIEHVNRNNTLARLQKPCRSLKLADPQTASTKCNINILF